MMVDEQMIRLVAVILAIPFMFLLLMFVCILILNARYRDQGFRYPPPTAKPETDETGVHRPPHSSA